MKTNRFTALLAALVACLVLATALLVAPGARGQVGTLLATLLAQPTNQASPTQPGAMHQLDKQAAPIPVRFVLTCTPPSYTKTGSAGSEVLTANANGALTASCTDGVTAVTGDRVGIVYNDTSLPDAGIFVLTQGAGGSPWVLARSTTNGENTAARLQGSTIVAREGFESGIWVSRQPTISAIGTTPLLWRPPGLPDPRHGWSANAQFSEAGANIVTPTINSGLAPYQGWLAAGSAAGASVVANGTGQGVLSMGTTTTGSAQLTSVPMDPTVARLEAEFGIRFAVSQLSDGSGTFTLNLGMYGDENNRSGLRLTPSAAGIAINHDTVVGGVAGAQRVLCASCFAINTLYRYVIRKAFGATVWSIWFDSGTGVLDYIADTPTLPTSIGLRSYGVKSAGAANRIFAVEAQWAWVWDPKALGV
jgi:hypothetical protein